MAGRSISIGEVGPELYSRSQSPSRFLLAWFRTLLRVQSTPRGRKEACRAVFTLPNTADFCISAARLAQEFLMNGIEHRQVVNSPVNGVEPKALGLSVSRELHLVFPEVLMRSDLVFGA